MLSKLSANNTQLAIIDEYEIPSTHFNGGRHSCGWHWGQSSLAGWEIRRSMGWSLPTRPPGEQMKNEHCHIKLAYAMTSKGNFINQRAHNCSRSLVLVNSSIIIVVEHLFICRVARQVLLVKTIQSKNI